MNREEKLMLRELHASANADQKQILEEVYPELKKSEGERIRRALIDEIKTMNARYSLFADVPKDRFIAWLEQQGEQKDIVNAQSDYVDLGLPSGTLWAKCNLGAEKETEFGKFFQWGDTQGYVATKGEQNTPTKEQLQELINFTCHKWVNIDGVNGMKFINKKDDTKYIFIPAAGYSLNGSQCSVGTWGNVWSVSRSESDANDAWYMLLGAGVVGVCSSDRCFGYSVRGVLNK